MDYQIKNAIVLNKILWIDFTMGASLGLIGLLFSDFFAPIFGLNNRLILWISVITVMYSIIAFRTVIIQPVAIRLLRLLIAANWAWTFIGLGIIAFHFRDATFLGQLFLLLQIVIVGGLAWLEGNQLQKK